MDLILIRLNWLVVSYLGKSSKRKKPSLSVPYSAPGTSFGFIGLPPTAIKV
jgi:hypothetical protein